MSELKPCPFCGGKCFVGEALIGGRFFVNGYHDGKCPIGKTVWCDFYRTEKECTDAWNRRVKETDTRSEQERWLNGE